MAGWGGELDYPRFQTSITDGGHGNRLVGALKTLRQRIGPVHERLKTVLIECLDWRECIDRYDRDGVVMYVDPPYPGNGCNYHHNMRSWDDHLELARRLRRTQCQWVYSSYNSKEVRDTFSGYPIFPVQSASGMVTKKNGSTRVTNDEVLVVKDSVGAGRPAGSASGLQPELQFGPADAE
jgi:DNA adenine methylase